MNYFTSLSERNSFIEKIGCKSPAEPAKKIPSGRSRTPIVTRSCGLATIDCAIDLDRNNPPRDEIRKQERDHAGDEKKKNRDKPDDGWIRVEHLADAGADAGDLPV